MCLPNTVIKCFQNYRKKIKRTTFQKQMSLIALSLNIHSGEYANFFLDSKVILRKMLPIKTMNTAKHVTCRFHKNYEKRSLM